MEAEPEKKGNNDNSPDEEFSNSTKEQCIDYLLSLNDPNEPFYSKGALDQYDTGMFLVLFGEQYANKKITASDKNEQYEMRTIPGTSLYLNIENLVQEGIFSKRIYGTSMINERYIGIYSIRIENGSPTNSNGNY